MRKTCAVCPAEFEAKREAAKYCSERCKKRAQRRPGGVQASVPSVKAAPPVLAPPAGSGLTAATLAELDAAGRLESSSGQAALALAQQIELGAFHTGSSIAAMVKEHRAALADAVRDVQQAMDPLDELRARRDRKLAAG